MFCTDISEPLYLIFSSETPSLLYYSHIPALLVSLILGFFVFFHNRKSLVAKILLLLNLSFAAWVFSNLILWVSVDSRQIMLFWSLMPILFTAISFLSFYFLYSFVNERDLSKFWKIVWFLVSLPIIVLTPTNFNLLGFKLTYCQADEYIHFVSYFLSLGLLSFLVIPIISGSAFSKKGQSLQKKKQIFYATLGIELFLMSFFLSSFLASYLVEYGVLSDFGLEMYGLFGMIIFMAFLTFLIVRFRAFNIRLLGAQALVISLVILIGSEFLFVENEINKWLVAITFVISGFLGLILIRSVKRIDDQKEMLERANAEQENLIHLISHQVKGFFTKSRNIFSTLSDEKENINPDYHKFIEEGLRSDSEGITLVEGILHAANLKTGKVEFANEKVNLNVLLAKIVDDNSVKAKNKDLKLEFEAGDSIIEIMGDEFRLRDALNNLVQNAVNYTFKGRVTVSLAKEGNNAKIVVEDTGVGLSSEDKEKLFTSGGRGAESIKYNVNSSGYGLYIARKVVDKFHGKIWAESAGRDKGSKFVVLLPLDKNSN